MVVQNFSGWEKAYTRVIKFLLLPNLLLGALGTFSLIRQYRVLLARRTEKIG